MQIAAAVQEAADEAITPADVDVERTTVLLVDDDAMVLRVGTAMLKRLGYGVIAATTGEDALRLYETARPRVALVICDENMPGMRGSEVVRALRARHPAARIVISSGDGLAGEAEGRAPTPEDTPTAWLHKPYHIGDMADLIKDILLGE